MKPTAPLRDNRRCSEPVACLDYVYFFCALLLAAHRAFISWDNLLRPAAVIPPRRRPPFFAVLPFHFHRRERREHREFWDLMRGGTAGRHGDFGQSGPEIFEIA